MSPIHQLDQPPDGAADAGADLRRLSTITTKIGLFNVTRRLLAIAVWCDTVTAIDGMVLRDMPAPRDTKPAERGTKHRKPEPNRTAAGTKASGSETLARPPAPPRAVSPAVSAVVVARDQAILTRLKTGPATVRMLRDVLPREPGRDDEDRYQDAGNAVARLKAKRLIKPCTEGWALA